MIYKIYNNNKDNISPTIDNKKDMEMEIQSIKQYDPLRWPPDLQLAKVHMSCVCPGKDNIEGIECPCCGRFEKIKTKKWYSRDIFKDFKNYGGGIPGYFSLLKYCAVSLLILSAIVILYHIYILENVCPNIFTQLQGCPGYQNAKPLQVQCQSFIYVFKICDTRIILNYLNCKGQFVKQFIFFYLQMFSFLYLIAATLGMKIWLRKMNSQKIEKEEKVYSLFSLMIKNIPKYYKIQELRKQIEQLIPEAEICQLFFLHEIAQLETNYKKLFDLHFVIEYIRESIAAERGETVQHLQQLITQYRVLYEKCQELKKSMSVNNGRAIVVFNKMQQRDKLKQMLSINECDKLIFHTFKLVGVNTRKLHFFADKIHQPQQIIWKYVGESSVTKTWVRIKTTFIGFGFMIVAFLLLYFPIIQIDVKSITNHSVLTSVLSVIVSIILQVLAIVYRQIILKILPDRHPSTRESESYFVVITTVVFHFFFYIIAPGTYFEIAQHIPVNIKLKQLFVAVVIFLIMTFLVAIIDLRYVLFNSRRKKIISKWNEWGQFCQIRLHEQLRWPSFPIEFKIMVLLNIWSFNAFYVFEIPYLMFLFAVVIAIIFWIDKRNIYKHYKMQVYQSIELELSVQRDYTIMFLVCVCCGYAVSAVYTWQYIFIGCTFIVSLIINFFIAYKTRQKQSKDYERALTLCQFVKAQSSNPKKSMLNDIITTEFKENVLILDNVSTVSLGSATLQYGYKQMYQNYLSQFKNKFITKLLLQTYNYYDHPEYNPEQQIDEIRRITNLSNLQGNKDNNNDDYYTNLYKTGKNRGNQLKSSQKKTSEDKSARSPIKQSRQIREESDQDESMIIDKNKYTLAKEQKLKNTQLKEYKMNNGQ